MVRRRRGTATNATRLKDLALEGAAARVTRLQAQIDDLYARFPGLNSLAHNEPAATLADAVARKPRRRRRAQRQQTGWALRKPGSGEVKAFVLAHGDLAAHQADEARRLQALMAKDGLETKANVVAATLSRVRRAQHMAYDKG